METCCGCCFPPKGLVFMGVLSLAIWFMAFCGNVFALNNNWSEKRLNEVFIIVIPAIGAVSQLVLLYGLKSRKSWAILTYGVFFTASTIYIAVGSASLLEYAIKAEDKKGFKALIWIVAVTLMTVGVPILIYWNFVIYSYYKNVRKEEKSSTDDIELESRMQTVHCRLKVSQERSRHLHIEVEPE